jgi:cytochrome c biogenesis protein CcdA
LGFGLPLLFLSLLSGTFQRQLTTLFARHGRIINLVGGLLLIGIAIYDVYKNWDLLRLFYA